MITSRIVGLATGDSLLLADVAGVVFGFAAFFAIVQTLEMPLENSPSPERQCIQFLAKPIHCRPLFFCQVGFFAISMFRTVVPCHFAPVFFVGTDLRFRMSEILP